MLTPLPRYYELSSTTLATIVVTYELRRATILLYFTEEEKRENDPNFVSVSIGQQHSYLPSLFEGEMTQAFANKVTMYPCQLPILSSSHPSPVQYLVSVEVVGPANSFLQGYHLYSAYMRVETQRNQKNVAKFALTGF